MKNNNVISTKNVSRTTVFNIEEMFLEQQIRILEWFMKDHVTLKTDVGMLKKKIQNGYFNNITVFTSFWTNRYNSIVPFKNAEKS